MHDIAFIRAHPEAFDAGLAKRGAEPASARILALDARRREAQTALQHAQSRRNEASKLIGQAMAKGDRDAAEALKAEVAALKDTMPAQEEAEREASEELQDLLSRLPNLPADDVPEGEDEGSNVEIARWGTLRDFDFQPKEHADLGPPLGLDFETGAALSGARFTFLRGGVARLHRALGQFMLDHQTGANGYTECNPPVLVGDAAMYGTDKLPKFAEDSFQVLNEYKKIEIELRALTINQVSSKSTQDELRTLIETIKNFTSPSSLEGLPVETLKGIRDVVSNLLEVNERVGKETASRTERYDQLSARFEELRARGQAHALWLIPTSEVSLTASVAGRILPDLPEPIRLTAHTLCFRSEAGAAGRDTRGFIRQHQFEKVELVSICAPDASEAEHERMVRCAESVLEALELPYRKLLLCTGDMGFGARKTYDLEVWLPGQGAYREISSCSNTGDFQARRMNTRYRPGSEKGTRFVHTLNGSGLAVGRTLVAVLENYQQEDGTVTIPQVLAPYMGGIERLTPL